MRESIGGCVSFNPRSYVRSDVNDWLTSPWCDGFNPRSYVRSDMPSVARSLSPLSFNPRSYVMSDPMKPTEADI